MKHLIGAALCAAALGAHAQPLKLHVPSPDWRDQVLYMVMTDRFDDGNPRNNDQGVGAYDPTRGDKVNGGDLAGLQRRLDYLQALGATGVWITPPVLNQWYDPMLGYWGYHGYWAQHFKKMDPHLGSLADYRRLSDALHRRGMVLVQDIVVNHTGNHFEYGPGWRANDPTRGLRLNPRSRPSAAPTQPPFDLIDPRKPAHRRAAIYHWTPAIRDVTRRDEELNFQTSGLDDLNTENPVVRRALRDSYGWWIREVGVDGFRVDTAYHVPPEFFEDFIFSRDARAPGMAEVARRTGRRDFLVFGEGFGIDAPGEDRFSAKLESYVRGERGQQRMGGMLNFPLYAGLHEAFARGRPTADLGARIESMVAAGTRGVSPHRLPSFIDNHDVDRFLAGADEAALKQALLAVMTLPGIPVVYYGTEQGFTLQRAAMFGRGWGSGGRDRFDTASPLFRYTAATIALRREHRLLSRGTPRVVHASHAGPGALAWRTEHEGRAAIVAFNTAANERLLDNLDLGTGRLRLRPVFDIDGAALPVVRAGCDGRIHLRLPPRSGRVWLVEPDDEAPPPACAAPALAPTPREPVTADIDVTGRVAVRADATSGTTGAGGEPLLVVDGDLARAQPIATDAQGRFTQRVDTRRMTDASHTHRVVVFDPQAGTASPPQPLRVALPWRELAEAADPAGDDRGPDGRYAYPTHESFAPRQMDIRHLRVSGAGGALRVEVQMASLTRVWNPANGFDHVAFSVFVELPGRSGGATAMPGQNGTLPDGMRWHLRLRAHGWTNALFGADGAGPDAEGTPLTPAASIRSDAQRRTVTFEIASAALGDPATLAGARVYVTTWDYDGGWRALGRDAAPFAMGGGSERDPKVMDAAGPVTLR